MTDKTWGVWCVEDRQWCFNGTRDEAEAELPRWASGRAAAVDPSRFNYEIRCCTDAMVLSHSELHDEIAKRRDEQAERCRDAARALAEAVGATGPSDLECAIIAVVKRLQAAEMACDAANSVAETLVWDDGCSVSLDTIVDMRNALKDWQNVVLATRTGDAASLGKPTPGELMRRGGEWLGVARGWMQRRARNGESVTWGSREALEMSVVVEDIEHLAAEVASMSMRPQPSEERLERMQRALWTADRCMQEANKTAADAQEGMVAAKDKMWMAQDQIHEAVARAKQAEATRDGAQKAASDAVDRARIAEKERDEALAKYQFMVNRAANEKLDGYRELGEKAAHAERERDSWHQAAMAWELLARKGADLAINIEKLCHPDSGKEEFAALIVWSDSVCQLPFVGHIRAANIKKDGP